MIYKAAGTATSGVFLNGYISVTSVLPGVYYVYTKTAHYAYYTASQNIILYVNANGTVSQLESIKSSYCRWCYPTTKYYLNGSYIGNTITVYYTPAVALNASYNDSSKITINTSNIISSNSSIVVFTTSTTLENTVKVDNRVFIFTNTITATVTAKADMVQITGVIFGPLNPVTLKLLAVSWYLLLSIILIAIMYHVYRYVQEGDKQHLYRAAIAASVPIIIKITLIVINALTGGG